MKSASAVEYVLSLKMCEECPELPVLRLLIPFDMVEFFEEVKGWDFQGWVMELLETRDIYLPEGAQVFIEHPVFVIKRGYDIKHLPKVNLLGFC
jgi:hypothetical protein